MADIAVERRMILLDCCSSNDLKIILKLSSSYEVSDSDCDPSISDSLIVDDSIINDIKTNLFIECQDKSGEIICQYDIDVKDYKLYIPK